MLKHEFVKILDENQKAQAVKFDPMYHYKEKAKEGIFIGPGQDLDTALEMCLNKFIELMSIKKLDE